MAKPEIVIPKQYQIDHLNQLQRGPKMIRDAALSEHLDATEIKIAKAYLYGVTRELKADGIPTSGVIFHDKPI